MEDENEETKHCPAYEYHVETKTYRPHQRCPECPPPLSPEALRELERSLARAFS